MYKTDLREDPNVKLGHFSTKVYSSNVFIGKLIETFGDFRKNHDQKHLMSEVLKLAILLLPMPAISIRATFFYS